MFKISKLEKISFKNMNFYYSKKTFLPTGTSEILADEACKIINNKNYDILDFGCGIGVVGIYIAKKKIIVVFLHQIFHIWEQNLLL